MKKIIIGSILSILSATSFAAPNYDDLVNSPKKEEFLKNTINNAPYIEETLGKRKCEEVSSFKQLHDTGVVVFVQVSCKNIKNDLHLLLPKNPKLIPLVHTCKEAAKKFIAEAQCVKN